MRWYWIRIALGSLLVFGVGYTGYRAVTSAVDRGKDLFDSSNPITIPLALVPFSLDGQELGTFQRVTIRREAPRVPSGIDLRIKLGDEANLDALRVCRLTLSASGEFDLDEGFHCLEADATVEDMVPFGEVRFRRADSTVAVQLYLPQATVEELKSNHTSIVTTRGRLTRAQAEREAARAEAMADRVRVRADSMAAEIEARVREAVPEPPPGP